MLKIVIGLENYSGAACGLNFEESVAQNVPEEWTEDDPHVRRLLLLFPGTTVGEVQPEELEELEKLSPALGQDDEKVRAKLSAAVKVDEDAAKASVEDEEVEAEVLEEVEEVEEEVEESTPLSINEEVDALVEDNTRDELVDVAGAEGATFSSRATKGEIALEIVEHRRGRS